MPRQQDFSKSTIYHIRNIETKKVVYVGSTTNFLVRKNKHKHSCIKPNINNNNNQYNQPIYKYIRDNGEWNSYIVVPVLQLSLENNIQLLIEEQKEIDKYDTLINCKKSKQDTELYKKESLERLNKWKEDNTDREKQAKKDYTIKHRDKILQNHKDRYNANKTETNEKRKEKMTCECGCIVRKADISRHIQSIKHQNLMKIK